MGVIVSKREIEAKQNKLQEQEQKLKKLAKEITIHVEQGEKAEKELQEKNEQIQILKKEKEELEKKNQMVKESEEKRKKEEEEQIQILKKEKEELEKKNQMAKESEEKRKKEEEENKQKQQQSENAIKEKIEEAERLLDEEFKSTLSDEMPKEDIALLLQIFRKETQLIKSKSADATWKWEKGTLEEKFKENRRFENTEEYIAKVSKRLWESDDNPEFGSDEYCDESDEAVEVISTEDRVEKYFQRQLDTFKKLDEERVKALNKQTQKEEMHQCLKDMHNKLIEEINSINIIYKEKITECVERGTDSIRKTVNDIHQAQKEKVQSVDVKRVQNIEDTGILRIKLDPVAGDKEFVDKIIEIKKGKSIDNDTLRAVLQLVRQKSEKSIPNPLSESVMRGILADIEKQPTMIDPKIHEGKERGNRTERNIDEELKQQRQSFSFADSVRSIAP